MIGTTDIDDIITRVLCLGRVTDDGTNCHTRD